MGAFVQLPDSDLVKMFNLLARQVFYCSFTKELYQQRQKGFWEPDYKHISSEPQARCTEYEYVLHIPTVYSILKCTYKYVCTHFKEFVLQCVLPVLGYFCAI